MSMKKHILIALREQFEHWEELLSRLSEEELITSHFDLGWSIKDVMAHLWAWQQISIARMEAGAHDRDPKYPEWLQSIGGDWEEDANRVNALTFERNHGKPWSDVYENWRNGFLQFLELGDMISERNLLDGDRYTWLHGHSLAFILIASYDHHQEHLQKLQEWRESRRDQ